MRLNIGDEVLIVTPIENSTPELNDSMRDNIGKKTLIRAVCNDYYELDIDGGTWSWPISSVKLISVEIQETIKVISNSNVNIFNRDLNYFMYTNPDFSIVKSHIQCPNDVYSVVLSKNINCTI